MRIRPLLAAAALSACALAAPARPLGAQVSPAAGPARLPITVERHLEGAPLTLGVPFPKGALMSSDQVRVLTPDGREVPAQVTEVSTWEPADPSLKWIWVFFFAGRGQQYVLEYGPGVTRSRDHAALEVVNNQRAGGLLEVTTGPMRFVVQQGDTGFLKSVALDLDGNGFDDADVIAGGPAGRGSFVDLLDEAGVDASKATITQTFIERGSGPLHAVLRIDGEYRYERADNTAAPFTMRIHAYAGQPYVRVLHTFVYTGTPDQHRPVEGDYAHLATEGAKIVTPDPTDTGWSMANDRINASGLGLDLKLGAARRTTAGWHDGRWWTTTANATTRARAVGAGQAVSVFQSGPKPDRIPPVPESTPTGRLSGFVAELSGGAAPPERGERAEGWLDIADDRRGVAIGIRHFIEEYPKELAIDPSGRARAFT